MMNSVYALIMAGGEGTRFAPLSTAEKPKQFLNFIGDGTFLQQTVKRILSLVPLERVLVATNDRYARLVQEQLPNIRAENIILETAKKNTAPCIAYSARLIVEVDPDAVIVVLPCDHAIRHEDRFMDVIRHGVDISKKEGRIVTIGIRPTWPATCYGYIKASGKTSKDTSGAHAVEAFVEKPDEEKAKLFITSGHHYWNSGIFVFTARTILEEVARHLRDMTGILKGFEPGNEFRDSFFAAAESISIDYGVMEKSNRVSVIPADLGWSDVGTWEGLYRLHREEKVTVASNVLKIMRD
ncbi:MAG: mannose-1-phosphate guanylyltransferase, partial [Pseudomonadota bacterium]